MFWISFFREVTVYKCIGKDTIEENILKCGEKKLRLEKEVVGGNEHGMCNMFVCRCRRRC